ncbi:hypothetical protein VTJ04DRAFT_10550 [Mycothermus thermophilus]|uniref:uncharacterized protein n=1 Tax=Humicola insolens TaxID=85995 RepID=UPI0037439B22
MEQPFSTSKVTVEYHDPHDVYKLLAPGLIPRLPLRDLNWQSHSGPLRSISSLHVELVPAGVDPSTTFTSAASLNPKTSGAASDTPASTSTLAPATDDGFQPATVAGSKPSAEQSRPPSTATLRPPVAPPQRRHQIPGLRRTPYLKLLLVRCDDNETYKSTTRAEIREWIKANTAASQGGPGSHSENHDAFEWLLIHVVLPNSTAATQPRVSKSSGQDSTDSKSAVRWRGGSSTLLEKMRADFNGSSKGAVDRVRQIRIGINDVPYHMLPRVVPAVPTGYVETEQDSENAWADLMAKIKELILSSFDRRVTQYEEDIRERDAQRALPGWNFCTFFILKEGLARGFESVGLVEDALVIYDELSVGLDSVIKEQAASGDADAHGGALLPFTEDLKEIAQKALDGELEFDDSETVDLQSGEKKLADAFDGIPISSAKKPYRDLILANNVSLFDFRCYIFARQVALLLRLGNAWSSREELLAKLKEQQELVPRGVAPRAPAPKLAEEPENLLHLAEICKRTLEFVPAVSSVMRRDVLTAMSNDGADPASPDPRLAEIVDNMVAAFAFSVAQQILAQTSTKALPIPPSTLGDPATDRKSTIPEPTAVMHPTRSSSLRPKSPQGPPKSPLGFPGPGRPDEPPTPSFPKAGLEELAARRAELCTLSRNILEECGKKRGWTDGWASVPIVGETGVEEMEEVSLDDDDANKPTESADASAPDGDDAPQRTVAGVSNALLRTALDNKDDFYRLYETLTDKALRHYTVANHVHAVQANMADLAVLKLHLGEHAEAASYFYRVIPFYGESGWSLLELSMLVMYARCLKALGKIDDYVNKALRQLLCKAAAAERDRLQHKTRLGIFTGSKPTYPDTTALSGFLNDLLEASASMPKDVRIPLASLFSDLGLDGAPIYDDGQDGFSLSLVLRSLLPDQFEAASVSLRLASSSGAGREIWLQSDGPVVIRPGLNTVKLRSTAFMEGTFEVDQIRVVSRRLVLHYERESQSDKGKSTLGKSRVTLHQRASCLDVQLTGARDLQLDKKKCLDLELTTGWNDLASCEVKVRAATGGLRLVLSEAEVISTPESTTHSTTQSGSFTFSTVPTNSSVRIRIPFTVETDLLEVTVRAEVSYTTTNANGKTFSLFKSAAVPLALALEVNVQDIFKHSALFSRFAVSTASDSPLRLLESELTGSELFDAEFGFPSSQPVVVFPGQPASLLYKITRKKGVKLGPDVKKTLYLKLEYRVVLEEVECRLRRSLTAALGQTPVKEWSKVAVAKLLGVLRDRVLTGYELEKATLLGALPLKDALADVVWEKLFAGLGRDVAVGLGGVLRRWVVDNPVLGLPGPGQDVEEKEEAGGEEGLPVSSILIPVDVPSVPVVHTADIRLHKPLPVVAGTDGQGEEEDDDDISCPTVLVNQVLPATLHLRWTRVWDTAGERLSEDLEFGYEIVGAPTVGGGVMGVAGGIGDAWLVGGRRKGHFVIPAVEDVEKMLSSAGDGDGDDEEGEEKKVVEVDGFPAGLTSTMETEADIPLVLIPLREGYLPYPGVEIREINTATTGAAGQAGGNCETDFKNMGETVLVVADRGRVTLSLDASGSSGGPLVLETEPAEGLRRAGVRVVV